MYIRPRFTFLVALGLAAAVFLALPVTPSNSLQANSQINSFELVSVFEVQVATGGENESAEIVTATKDGKTLIYTDAVAASLGFVDISDPSNPEPDGSLEPPNGGEPTSVTVTPNGKWALVAVHDDGAGYLWVVDLSDFTTEHTIPLTNAAPFNVAQPDSVAVSPNGRYAAVAIENERDEEVNDGIMPQAPAGFLVIVDLVGAPTNWGTRFLKLTGIANRFADDPEPEFIDINSDNEAAVTLQENNHIVIVDLKKGKVTRDFSAGKSIHRADLTDDDSEPAQFTEWLNARREPDSIHWTP
ncbi:MAG TPA: alkaline phosphatase, partial [Dehalococcoidia bacterium]|nr:alkaline phosphatase [Dehalococcoidia bacterium]